MQTYRCPTCQLAVTTAEPLPLPLPACPACLAKPEAGLSLLVAVDLGEAPAPAAELRAHHAQAAELREALGTLKAVADGLTIPGIDPLAARRGPVGLGDILQPPQVVALLAKARENLQRALGVATDAEQQAALDSKLAGTPVEPIGVCERCGLPTLAGADYCAFCGLQLHPTGYDGDTEPAVCPHGVATQGLALVCPLCENEADGHLIEFCACEAHGGDGSRGHALQELLAGWGRRGPAARLWCPGPERGAGHWFDPSGQPAPNVLHPEPVTEAEVSAAEHVLMRAAREGVGDVPAEGPAEHMRNALQILGGVISLEGEPAPLGGAELFEAVQGIAARLRKAAQHERCTTLARYELGVSLGLCGGLLQANPLDPSPDTTRRDALQFLRFRVNAALHHQGEPLPPSPEALAKLGIIPSDTWPGSEVQGPSDRGEGAANADAVIVPLPGSATVGGKLP